MLEKFFTRWSLAIVVVCIAFVPLGTIASIDMLRTSHNNVDDWLPSAFEEARTARWFNQHFKGDEILVVSWEGCVLGDDRLELLAAAVEQAIDQNGIKLFRRVLTGTRLYNSLIEESKLTEATAKGRLYGWLLNKENGMTCLICFADTTANPDRHYAIAEVKRLAVQAVGLEESALRIGGPTADSVNIDLASLGSLYWLSSLSFIVGVLLAFLFLRSAVLVAVSFSAAVLSELLILALMWMFGVNMDAVLTMVPLLVYVLTICASVHFLNNYKACQENCKLPHIDALKVSLNPTFLAMSTTAIGLLSLTVSDLSPVKHFGLYGAIGVLLTMPVLFVYQTALLAILAKLYRRGSPQHLMQPSRPSWYLRISDYAIGSPSYVLISASILVVISFWGTRSLATSSKLTDMFSPNSRSMSDYRWLETNVGSLVPVNVVVCFPKENDTTILDRARITESVGSAIAASPYLSGVISATSFLPSFRDSQGAKGVVRRAAANASLESRRGELIERGMIALSDTEELWLVSGRFPVFCDTDYDKLTRSIEDKVAEKINTVNTETLQPRAVVCGGVPVITSIQKRLLLDLKASLATSVLTIGVVLAISLRSILATCLLLFPNVVPALMMFGFMGSLGISIDLGAMLTISTSIGIAVDNELHFISLYKRHRKEGTSPASALRLTLKHSGTSMFQSGIIVICGMLVLTFSPFLPTVRFGTIMAMLIALALVADLVILPAILSSRLNVWFEPRDKKSV